MTGIEIIKKFPLSIQLIKEWYHAKMLEALTDKSISEEFAKYMLEQGVPDELIVTTLEDNPRMLFDIFDANNVIIETSLYPDNTFTIKIGKQGTTQSWKTRKEAEAFALEAAFDILEEGLSDARIDIIAQNGNTGEHYEIEEN